MSDYEYLRSVVEQVHRDLHDALAETPVPPPPETPEPAWWVRRQDESDVSYIQRLRVRGRSLDAEARRLSEELTQARAGLVPVRDADGLVVAYAERPRYTETEYLNAVDERDAARAEAEEMRAALEQIYAGEWTSSSDGLGATYSEIRAIGIARRALRARQDGE